MRKEYSRPKLERYGRIEVITQLGGGAFIDFYTKNPADCQLDPKTGVTCAPLPLS